MHIAFAIVFFLFVGLCETLRHGIFGLNPSEVTGITAVALALSAFLILRGDIVFTLRQPRHDLYEESRFNWTWPRTVLGLALGPMLWIIPVAYGLTLVQITIVPVPLESLIEALVMQVLLVALAEELFFREAAIKAFHSSTGAIYLISGLAFFIYYIPQGVPTAMIAAGTGLYFVTLRLIGTNILAVALIHGATSVMLTQVLSLGVLARDSTAEWVYAGYFVVTSVVLSAAVHQIFAQKRSVFSYA